MLDAAGHHAAVFGVYALQVVTDGQPAGLARVDTVQVGEVRVGDKEVFADIPIPGSYGVGGGQRQLQALLGVLPGPAPLVGFDGGDQTSSTEQ